MATQDRTFDFVVIGSGFGGSVSAMRLAEKGYSVLVLERGKRWAAGDFPKSNWNLFKFLWLPGLRCFGFMGINLFEHIMILSGSGVGGGSLVYAATLLEPEYVCFWNEGWIGLADWERELPPYYDMARLMLGVAVNPRLWPADHHLREIAAELGQADTFQPTAVGIYFGEEGKTVPDPFFDGEGPPRTGCIHCGGCMVGCRHNAKNSLDKNYLYFAEKFGAEIRPETEAVDIRPVEGSQADGARYEVLYRRSTAWLPGTKRVVRARNVIVAAGVLGTNRLLLRCRDETRSLPRLSRQLGAMVRSNSEALMGVTSRKPGPDYSQGIAITSHFWVDSVTSVEPVRYPRGSSFMRNLSLPLTNSLRGPAWRRLARYAAHGLRHPRDLLKVRLLPDWARDSTIILVMQMAENRMRMRIGRSLYTLFRKGLVTERDERLPIPPVIDTGRIVVERLAERIDGIPQTAFNEVLLNTPSTAHILGGCVMARDEEHGVVDVNHEVFSYPGLYVVDASVVPGNLGVNPSLTITALAERAMSRIPAKQQAPDRVAAGRYVRRET